MEVNSPAPHPPHPEEEEEGEDVNEFEDGTDSETQKTHLFLLQNGEPAEFYLHKMSEDDSELLTVKISNNGGHVTNVEDNVDVILTKKQKEYMEMRRKYAISPKTYVFMSGFVDECIDKKKFTLNLPRIKGRGPGRAPGDRRVPFTEEDDQYLAEYIAQLIPDKMSGGRTGHTIYEELMDRANEFDQNIWALRHTEHSWRERYRKNQPRLDAIIDEYLERNPPPENGKGSYSEMRAARHKGSRKNDGSETEESDGEEVQATNGKQAVPMEEEEKEEVEEVVAAEAEAEADGGGRGDVEGEVLEQEGDTPARPNAAEVAGRKRQRGDGAGADGPRRPSHGEVPPAKKQKAIPARRPRPQAMWEKPRDEIIDQGAQGLEEVSESPQIAGMAHGPSGGHIDERLPTPERLAEGQSGPTRASPAKNPRQRAVVEVVLSVRRTAKTAANHPPPSPGTMVTRAGPAKNLRQPRTVEIDVPARAAEIARSTSKKATNPPPAALATAVPDAPYTRTRARSRSVEPRQPAPAPRRKVVRKLPQKKVIPTIEEAEEPGSEDEDGDTQEVEENILVASDNEALFEEGIEDDDAHLSPDDFQTSQRLSSQAKGKLKAIGSDSDSDSSSDSDGVADTLNSLKKIAAKADTRNPRPITTNRGKKVRRQHTASSEELFPSPNTRARDLRARQESEAKRAEYVPPAGTRAAKLAGDRAR